MHVPADVRDAFLDLLDGTVPDDSTALWGLTGQLWNCTDPLPDWACAELDLPAGATYACGARAWRRSRRHLEALAS